MSKHDKFAARFGADYAATRPFTIVHLDILPWSRHCGEMLTDADMRRKHDRRRKGREIRKQRRLIRWVIQTAPKAADAIGRFTASMVKLAQQFMALNALTPDQSEAR